MTKIRNQSFVKQVLCRDFGLCRCCGYKASEVHHVLPLTFGGEDKVNNMICLCWNCHIHAPDSKEDFYYYMKRGGANTQLLLGKIVELCFEQETKSNGLIKANETIPICRQMMRDLKKMEYNWAIEKYNISDSQQIEDIKFTFKEQQFQSIDKGVSNEIV